MGTVRLVTFSRQELEDAIDFIKTKAHITRIPGEETKVYTTGVGGFQFKELMEKSINVKLVSIHLFTDINLILY